MIASSFAWSSADATWPAIWLPPFDKVSERSVAQSRRLQRVVEFGERCLCRVHRNRCCWRRRLLVRRREHGHGWLQRNGGLQRRFWGSERRRRCGRLRPKHEDGDRAHHRKPGKPAGKLPDRQPTLWAGIGRRPRPSLFQAQPLGLLDQRAHRGGPVLRVRLQHPREQRPQLGGDPAQIGDLLAGHGHARRLRAHVEPLAEADGGGGR